MAVNCLQMNPKLQQCDELSFCLSLMGAAEMGLTPGSTLGHAYIVPYFDKHSQRHKAQLQVGYLGMLECARRHPDVAKVEANAIYENDEFEFELGDAERLIHKPKLNNRGKLIGAWARCVQKDGTKHARVIGQEEADRARAASQSGKDDKGPWVTDTAAMWVKTAVRRLAKFIPQSHQLSRAIEIDNRAELGAPSESTAQTVREVPPATALPQMLSAPAPEPRKALPPAQAGAPVKRGPGRPRKLQPPVPPQEEFVEGVPDPQPEGPPFDINEALNEVGETIGKIEALGFEYTVAETVDTEDPEAVKELLASAKKFLAEKARGAT